MNEDQPIRYNPRVCSPLTDSPQFPLTFPAPVEIPDMTPEEAALPVFKAAILKMEKVIAAQEKRWRKRIGVDRAS